MARRRASSRRRRARAEFRAKGNSRVDRATPRDATRDASPSPSSTSIDPRPRSRVALDLETDERRRVRALRVHSATKTTVARASMNDFAEKVSKASVALGVAGAVLAQVRRTNRIRERDTSARYGWGVRARERRPARGETPRTSRGRSLDAENCPRRRRRRAARAPTASTSRRRAFAPS